MGCIYYDYEFKTAECKNTWKCLKNNTFENMELYYRKQMSMSGVMSIFRKTFKIAPVTIKNTTEDKYYKYKILAIYLLTQYSQEKFEIIAKEFHVSLETIQLIATNKSYALSFKDNIKSFFKTIEDDYLCERKSVLAFSEELSEFSVEEILERVLL